jgi:hypothetical protein
MIGSLVFDHVWQALLFMGIGLLLAIVPRRDAAAVRA